MMALAVPVVVLIAEQGSLLVLCTCVSCYGSHEESKRREWKGKWAGKGRERGTVIGEGGVDIIRSRRDWSVKQPNKRHDSRKAHIT